MTVVHVIVKYLLIGGSTYLVAKYGCKTVHYIIRSITSVIFGKSTLALPRWGGVLNTPIKELRTHLVCSEDTCREWVEKLQNESLSDGFLGFDCEWVDAKPVALIQLSTKNGFCVLFHISKMQSFPSALKEILEDDTILKVGVGTQNDAKLLFRDYQVQTQGCIDIRFFAPIRSKMGLAALALDHLGISLDKSSHVRRSDWAADTLSEEQCRYAGQDAYVGALLFAKLAAHQAKEAVAPYVGIHFKGSHSVSNKVSFMRRADKVKDENICISGEDISSYKAMRAYTPRKAPIYSNCKMLAPDGEVLCTCSRKKADWYVKQGLAKEFSVEPYQIQLLFEPSERFRGPSGLYYTQEKVNQCVVCGKKDSHLRKNIVPHEYRRHFPDAMKMHQSHDVLPLCQLCHLRSNSADISLRQKLAKECNALIGVGNDVKATDDKRLKKLRSAARALINGGVKTSENRRKELAKVVEEELPYYEEQLKLKTQKDKNDHGSQENETDDKAQGDRPSLQNLPLDEVLPKLTHIDISIANDNYIPHGLKVTEQFAKEGFPGLMRLEKMWREHFLETMKPRYLPELWSVSHYHNNERNFAEDEAFKNKMLMIKSIEEQS